MQVIRTCAAVVVLMSLACGVTGAAIVDPGQTNPAVNVDPLDYAVPSGDVVAQNTQDFVIEYDLTPDGLTTTDPQTFNATLVSSVVRDPATQRLTFVYQWQRDQIAASYGVGSERNTFAVESFAGFVTDISIASGAIPWVVGRSADGATINGDSVDVGGSILPNFFITTDATEFDANGTFSGTAGAEFGARDAEGESVLISPQSLPFMITGTFQPITDGGGTVIPLPAGVWLGVIALGAVGTSAKTRRLRLKL